MLDVQDRTDGEIYAAHAHELTVFARSLVGVDDAADVVSEAVLGALGSRGWSRVENHRAYLYRAVYNRAQTLLFRRSTRRTVEASNAVGVHHDQPPIDPTILQAVDGLPTQQRAVIALTYWRDLPIAEIAEILGVTDGTVRKQLARARARLRKVLDER